MIRALTDIRRLLINDASPETAWRNKVRFSVNAVIDLAQDIAATNRGYGATADRPAASDVEPGTVFYDQTLGKPIWSNGSAWKDAAGTTV